MLIKLNQIGTVTETFDGHRRGARGRATAPSVSHRSGETADDFIADFTVATGAGQLKTGAPCRGERVAKYNQLSASRRSSAGQAHYAGAQPFLRSAELVSEPAAF